MEDRNWVSLVMEFGAASAVCTASRKEDLDRMISVTVASFWRSQE